MSIIKRLLFITLFIVLSIDAEKKQHIIMLAPAGDSKDPGRKIGQSCERATTFALAHHIKTIIEKETNNKVLLSRAPGEHIPYLHSAEYANRINVDLYIALSCYHNPTSSHTAHLYLYKRGEQFIPNLDSLTLLPLAKAHWLHHHDSKKIAQFMHGYLSRHYIHQIMVPSITTFPFLPLYGVYTPALGIELNYIHQDDTFIYALPLAQTIITALAS